MRVGGGIFKFEIFNVIYLKLIGEMWEDPSMEDWNPNDYRIFCGNLGNEVTDEILSSAFRKYPSFTKARVW